MNLPLILLIMYPGSQPNVDLTQATFPTNCPATVTAQTDTYSKIKAGSFLKWHAAHLGGIDPRQGKIKYKEASISIEQDKILSARIIVDMHSLTVEDLPEEGIVNLTSHLKSDDFFDTENNPTSSFELISSEQTSGAYNSKLTGELTILNVTNCVTFSANVLITNEQVSVKSEQFVIDRSDWGMTYNAKGTLGVPLDYLISDDVGFAVDVTLTK